MDNYSAIKAVQAYIDDFLCGPSASWPEYQFRKRSYELYSANKILSLIASSGGIPAMTVVENLLLLLQKKSGCEETAMFFDVFREVATNICDVLRAMQ